MWRAAVEQITSYRDSAQVHTTTQVRVDVIVKILKRNGQELKSTFTKVMKQLINPAEEKVDTKYFAVEGVPQRYYVAVYKALEATTSC